jgi:hypothetical protein
MTEEKIKQREPVLVYLTFKEWIEAVNSDCIVNEFESAAEIICHGVGDGEFIKNLGWFLQCWSYHYSSEPVISLCSSVICSASLIIKSDE